MRKLIAIFLSLLLLSCQLSLAETEIIEIEFYQQNTADVAIFDEIIEVFEASHPNIRVKQINLPEAESGMVLNTRILNNDAPDLWNDWYSQDLFNKIDAGDVRNMTNNDMLELISPSILSDTVYNGSYYMIPMTTNFMGVYYNVDLFEEHNLAIPTTVDEFWALCEQLQSLGITPIAAGDMDGWNLAHWIQDVIGVYSPNYSEDFLRIYNGEMTVADMEGIEEVADIIVKRSQYVQPGCLGADSDTMVSLFLTQETAMLINGSWWMGTLNAAQPDFEYKVFPFPGATAEETRVMSNADFSFVLSSESSPAEQEAAETFVRWMLTEGAAIYIGQSGAPSALPGIKADSSRYELLMPYLTSGLTFRMPQSARWAEVTYLDYTIAVQNLTATGDIEFFYEEFTEALVNGGLPATYIK